MNDILLLIAAVTNVCALLYAINYFNKRYTKEMRQCTRDCFSDMKNASDDVVDQRIKELNARKRA